LGAKYWMFVPDLGQINSYNLRNICLSELVFQSCIEYQYELEKENNTFDVIRFIKSLIFPDLQAQTIDGLLQISQFR